ncbi:TPA: hypothetical protein ACMDS0_002933 [Vibrio cholerae]
MILWITENAELYAEPENVVIRHPEAIAYIEPNSPSMLLIDVAQPSKALLSWAQERSLPTLWWQPNALVPKRHCVVSAKGCDCKEFAFLLGLVRQREGITNIDCGELESALRQYSRMVVVPYQRLSTEYGKLQKCVSGYLILQGIESTFENLQQKYEKVKTTTAIPELYALLLVEDVNDMIWAFIE